MVCIFFYLEIHFYISYSSYIFIGRQIKDCPDYSRSRRSTGSRNFSSGGSSSRSSPSSCHGWNQDWRWASEAQEDTDQEIGEENQVRRRWSRCRLILVLRYFDSVKLLLVKCQSKKRAFSLKDVQQATRWTLWRRPISRTGEWSFQRKVDLFSRYPRHFRTLRIAERRIGGAFSSFRQFRRLFKSSMLITILSKLEWGQRWRQWST